MDDKTMLTVKVSLAPWVRFYLYGVVLMAYITDREPCQERVRYWVEKGVRVKLVHKEG